MIIYRTNKNGFVAEFIDLQEAINYADGLEVYQVNTIYEDNFYKDIEFGKKLIETFLLDNRNLPVSITLNDNLILLQKFAPIETLARLGDIKTISVLIQTIEIDNVFTQERKNKYITLIQNYLQ